MSSQATRLGLPLVANGIFAAIAMAAEHAGEHAAEAEPSLFAGDLGNAIWTLLIFFLVLFVLGKFAWNPLLSALQNREKFIRESLESARQDREAAEARLKEYEQRLQKAHAEAAALIEEGRRDAEAVRRRVEDETKKNADAMIERAKREIGIARDTALRDLYDQSADLAMTMAGNVMKRQMTPEDHQRLVQEALGELRKTSASEN